MGILNKALDRVRIAQGLQPIAVPQEKAINPNIVTYNPETSLQSSVKADPSSAQYQLIYSIQATVYRAVAVISSNLASLPFQLFKKTSKGDAKEDFTRDKVFDIFRNPNPWMTSYDFWEATAGYLELTGECPWALVFSGTRLEMIIPLRPDKIEIVPSATEQISHYLFNNGDGTKFEIPKDELIMLKYFNPLSDLRGLSPIKAAQLDIELDLRATSANKSMLEQGARPSGIITTNESLSDHIWHRYRQEFESKHTGELNRGKIMFLDSGMKWQQVGMTQEELQYMQQRQWTKDTISEVFGVPPVYLMQFKESSVLANAEVQYKLFWTMTMIPKLTKLSRIITKELIPLLLADDEMQFRFDYDDISAIQPDKKMMTDRFDAGIKNGSVSPNDFREHILDLPRIPDEAMDQYFIAANYIPVSAASIMERPEPGGGGNSSTTPEKEGEETAKMIDEYIDRISEKESLSSSVQEMVGHINKNNITIEEKVYIIKAENMIDRLEKTVVKDFSKVLIKLMNRQMAEVLHGLSTRKALTKFNPDDVNIDLDKWIIEYEAVGGSFIETALGIGVDSLAGDIGGSFTVTDPSARRYVKKRTYVYAQMVNGSLYKKINTILSTGIEGNFSIERMSELIQNFFLEQQVMRAFRIARTESVAGGNFGRNGIMKNQGIKYHMWLTTRDPLVRDHHASLDGVIRKVGASFPVTSEYLGFSAEFPSDINERCFTIPTKKP